MTTVMDMHEILKYLPHRPPFLLVDKVIDIIEGQSLTAIKNVSMNEPFFVGHFPERPVMPGVLIVEALAQAAGILAYKSTHTNPQDGVLYLFAGIDHVRFRRIVLPGDQLLLKVKLLKARREIWKLACTASVGEDLVCEAELLSARRG